MCVHGPTARTQTPPLKTHTACHTHAMGLRSPSCLLLLLVLLVPAAPQDPVCTNTDPCTGQPDCTGCDTGALVPDPDNCYGFYICSADGDPTLSFDCGDGQIFDATSRQCIAGDECDACPPPTASCSYECLADGPQVISSSNDCHSYYVCEGETVTGSGTCGASNPFFDGEECQTDESLCCHCHPYCTKDVAAGTIVADPLDCRGYYLCTAASEVPTLYGTCPDGENFDSLLHECSTAAGCNTQVSCLNVVGADGCIDLFTCVSVGYFAKCPNQCTHAYYHCTVTGTFQDAELCPLGRVFNPDTHSCVYPDNCPY